MDDPFTQAWKEIAERPDGPMAFRFYFQPIMAAIMAFKDGRRDAKHGNLPYFWALFTHPELRGDLIRSGWKSVGKIFILAVVLDLAYSVTVLKGIRPLQTILIALVLAVVPYVLLRGPFNRLFRSDR